MIHFISGLPRSGTTLLAAILRQNPKFHAAVETPLASVVHAIGTSISRHEASRFVTEAQREAITRGVIEGYYASEWGHKIVYDNNRAWMSQLPIIARLYPSSSVICCVRNPAWILDSFERLIQRNPFFIPSLFPKDSEANVYLRTEHLIRRGPVGAAMHGLRQAWFGEYARHLVIIRYDSLATSPQQTMKRLYEFLSEPPYDHDFNNLNYAEPEFDASLNTPGLHTVKAKIVYEKRSSILPPDIFSQNSFEFWNAPDQNTNGVHLL